MTFLNNEETLNRILSNSCRKTNPDEDGFITYELDLCCVQAVIIARPAEKILQYEGYSVAVYQRKLTEDEKPLYDYTMFDIKEVTFK